MSDPLKVFMKATPIIFISSVIMSSIAARENNNSGIFAKAGWYANEKGALHFIGKQKPSDFSPDQCPTPSSLICLEKTNEQGTILLEIDGGPYQP